MRATRLNQTDNGLNACRGVRLPRFRDLSPRIIAVMAALAGCVGSALEVSSANAMSAPIQITQDVNLRGGPSAATARVGGIYAGASPDFHCWTQGQNIGGVDVWFNVTYNGATGFYASYYDNSSYATDAQITPKYGIPQCGAAAPPQPAPPQPVSNGITAAENAVIAWARPYANAHNTSYNGLCLTFVFRAYAAAGVNLRQWVNVPIGSNTYPSDVWGHFVHGHTGGGTPPAGALVFYGSRYGRTYSHVALSLGGGSLISTSDSVAHYTHYETTAQHSYAIYLGWWLPDA
jgi:uncharacterized protein YraI